MVRWSPRGSYRVVAVELPVDCLSKEPALKFSCQNNINPGGCGVGMKE